MTNPTSESKPGPKMTDEQHERIIELLCRQISQGNIVKIIEREFGVKISQPGVSYYATQYAVMIQEARTARIQSAMSKGFAVKENRVAALNEHAEELYMRRWDADGKGRCHNEKAYRECLADIAAETGGRKVNMTVTPDIDAAVQRTLESLAAVVSYQIGDNIEAGLERERPAHPDERFEVPE